MQSTAAIKKQLVNLNLTFYSIHIAGAGTRHAVVTFVEAKASDATYYILAKHLNNVTDSYSSYHSYITVISSFVTLLRKRDMFGQVRDKAQLIIVVPRVKCMLCSGCLKS